MALAAALAALPALAAAQPPACASATVTGHDSTGAPTLRISPGAAPAKGAAAWASYAATYTAIGWDVINVSTAPGVAPRDAMYAAGYLEGWLTHEAIYTSYQNSQSPPKPPARLPRCGADGRVGARAQSTRSSSSCTSRRRPSSPPGSRAT